MQRKSFLFVRCYWYMVPIVMEKPVEKESKIEWACVVYHQTGQTKQTQHEAKDVKMRHPFTSHLGISYTLTFHNLTGFFGGC